MGAHPFDWGGLPGTLMVSIDKFYGDNLVSLELRGAKGEAHLTAVQARALAADLISHADYLDAGR